MLPTIITDIVLIVLLLVMLWIALRVSGRSRNYDDITRLETKLDEYAKRINGLDERLNDLKLEQQTATSQLRERLVAAFSELREELRQILFCLDTHIFHALLFEVHPLLPVATNPCPD